MTGKKFKGFTLIELLLVIGIISILTGIVLIAVNPARQMAQARNAERAAEANAILNAVTQFQVDYGMIPDCIATTPSNIGTAGCDLSATDLLSGIANNQAIVPSYIAEIPIGPGADCSVSDTCYDIAKTTANPPRVVVSAPGAELGVTINYTR